MHKEFPQVEVQNNIEQQNRNKIYEVAKKGLIGVFESYDNGRERINSIQQEVRRMADHLDNHENILADLEACAPILDKKEFMEKVFEAAKPLIDLKIDNPKIFIEKDELEKEYVDLNEMLSYVENGDSIHIHIIPNEVVTDISQKFTQGLKKLAEIVNGKSNIGNIEAESWIIKKHPKIIEKFGFTVDDYEKGRASISRDDFLKRYFSAA